MAPVSPRPSSLAFLAVVGTALCSGCSRTEEYGFEGILDLDIDVDHADIEVIGSERATETRVEVLARSPLDSPESIVVQRVGDTLSVEESCPRERHPCRLSVRITVPRGTLDEVVSRTWKCESLTMKHLDATVEALAANGPDCVITLEDLTGNVHTGGDADTKATDLSGDWVRMTGGALDITLSGTPTWMDLFGPEGIDVTLPAGSYYLDIPFDKSPVLVGIAHDPDSEVLIDAGSPSVTLTGI